MILHLARIAPLLAALFCWRVSRPAAFALVTAFAASVAYVVTPVLDPRSLEPLRWVSALVGLVGAVEFGRGAPLTRFVTVRGSGGAEIYGLLLPRRSLIGLFLIASMVGDGAAYLAWIKLNEWVMPVAQICVCAAIIAVVVWPERKPS